MKHVGEQYRFHYKVEGDETEDNVDLLRMNDGHICTIIDRFGGGYYEVQSDTGNKFLVYDEELSEVQ